MRTIVKTVDAESIFNVFRNIEAPKDDKMDAEDDE